MDIDYLKSVPLFKGLEANEIKSALSLLNATEKEYPKGTILLHTGSKTAQMGLVLSGSVTIEINDYWGGRTILSHVGKGQFFAETYAMLEDELMLVDVKANEDCRIAFFDLKRIRYVSEQDATIRRKLTENILMISMHKNLILSERSFHTSPKTIRDRVLSYLNTVSLQKGGPEFDIPFDRQQLADYLNVERTALSKELGRMQRDGYFRFRKNHFVIIKAPED